MLLASAVRLYYVGLHASAPATHASCLGSPPIHIYRVCMHPRLPRVLLAPVVELHLLWEEVDEARLRIREQRRVRGRQQAGGARREHLCHTWRMDSAVHLVEGSVGVHHVFSAGEHRRQLLQRRQRRLDACATHGAWTQQCT